MWTVERIYNGACSSQPNRLLGIPLFWAELGVSSSFKPRLLLCRHLSRFIRELRQLAIVVSMRGALVAEKPLRARCPLKYTSCTALLPPLIPLSFNAILPSNTTCKPQSGPCLSYSSSFRSLIGFHLLRVYRYSTVYDNRTKLVASWPPIGATAVVEMSSEWPFPTGVLLLQSLELQSAQTSSRDGTTASALEVFVVSPFHTD